MWDEIAGWASGDCPVFVVQIGPGIAASGPRTGSARSGPVVFLDRGLAERIAAEKQGRVVERTLRQMVGKCLEWGATLFVYYRSDRPLMAVAATLDYRQGLVGDIIPVDERGFPRWNIVPGPLH